MPEAHSFAKNWVRGAAAMLALVGFVAPHRAFADPPKSSGSAASQSNTSAPQSTAAPMSPADVAKEKKDRQERAIALHDEAKALYDRGLYRRAITKLEAALELDPSGKELVYNLAVIHEKLADVDDAEKYYLRYVDMETNAGARERALAIVKRLRAAKKNLEADLQERAQVGAVGATVAPSATAAPTAPTNRMPSPMVFVIGGVGVAAIGIGIGFGVSALSTYPDGLSTGPRVTAYDLETRARSAHTQAIAADLSFVTAFVMGAAATVLYLVESRGGRGVPVPAPAGTGTGTPLGSTHGATAPLRGPAPQTPARAAALVRMEAPF
ncbi:MAG: tetratricopeptide repeat protein [Polyangiaceae bacterium]|nr:tetratricopeptide repeat protein [Polyangiaceae bacterium]